MKKNNALIFLALFFTLTGGCRTMDRKPIRIEPQVDLQRFMGSWYVIANIPTFIEKEAYNAVESYQMNPDGTIATTFTFRKGGFEGPQKKYTPKGFVRDKVSNAVWGMRFVWPFKGDYRIVYLSPDYSVTVIGREKRDYVWIMARKPVISEAEYQKMVTLAGEEGYDTSKIQKVPQKWPA